MTDQRTATDAQWEKTYRDMVTGAESLHELVFLALGAGSMCWTNPETAGRFESTRAALLGNALLDEILRRTGSNDERHE